MLADTLSQTPPDHLPHQGFTAVPGYDQQTPIGKALFCFRFHHKLSTVEPSLNGH